MELIAIVIIGLGFFYFLGKKGLKGIFQTIGFTIKGCLIFILLVFVLLFILSGLIT